MTGYGTYRFADGMTYEGVMRDDRPCGEGTARYRNGGVYEGRWKDGFCEVGETYCWLAAFNSPYANVLVLPCTAGVPKM